MIDWIECLVHARAAMKLYYCCMLDDFLGKSRIAPSHFYHALETYYYSIVEKRYAILLLLLGDDKMDEILIAMKNRKRLLSG